MLAVTKYPVYSPVLKSMVAFYWHMTSAEAANLHHQLLPVISSDLIINLSAPVHYEFPKEGYATVDSIHLCNVKRKAQYLTQQGHLDVWGVCFFPYGLYPFLGGRVAELPDQILELNKRYPTLAQKLIPELRLQAPVEQKIQALERMLENALQPLLFDFPAIALLQHFQNNCCNTTLSGYCREQNLTLRQLERTVKKHTGTTPKQFQQVCRFQAVSNRMIHRDGELSLTQLAQDFYYYDQTHFIKDFKSYTGVAPMEFLQKQDSIKEVTEFHPAR